MYLANKDLDDEAFRDLEIIQRAKKSIEFEKQNPRHPADAQTEYNIYKKSTEQLQQKLAELEASYSIVCVHGVKLEKALAETKRQLDQAKKSWIVAMLMRFGLMK